MKLWRENSSEVASFNTTFELFIQPVNREPCGEGMAFIVTNNLSLPRDSHGQWLGIVNEATNGLSSNGIIAIEFDTRKSSAEDIDDNHVAVDANGIGSIVQFPLINAGVNLSTDVSVVKIQYDGDTRHLTVYVSTLSGLRNGPERPVISYNIDLSKHLTENVYVGFSGSTGDLTQLNYVYSWSVTSTNVTEKGNNVTEKGNQRELVLALALSTTCVICGGSLCYLWWRTRISTNGRVHGNHNLLSMLRNSSHGPRKFRFKELKLATSNFNARNKLGQGGFGAVYKGFLKDGEEVAVKRVSKDSHQGEQEFAAEITTISHLGHKNLVRLIGWCYERDELLLVYEFMPNGSLDKLIFPSEKSSSKNTILLSWERRHKIICGVASALSYLHDGCRNCVLHRDVKSSNVMLDSDYNARLGDFGLARAIQHDGDTQHLTTTVAGTPGYIAPECFLTGRASVETDVYGFGAFAMEVACGRRPRNNLRDANGRGSSIVDWLWDLYGTERILDAVDPQLHGMFDAEQVEIVLKLGLACCHPNPNERPKMRLVLQVLNGEAPAPVLPIEKPTFMWPVMDSNAGVASVSFEEPSTGGGRLTPSMDFSGR